MEVVVVIDSTTRDKQTLFGRSENSTLCARPVVGDCLPNDVINCGLPSDHEFLVIRVVIGKDTCYVHTRIRKIPIVNNEWAIPE
jgi:hypothetical protein